MLFQPRFTVFLVVLIIPALLLCLLQWWLSGRKSPIPGLILPILHAVTTLVLLIAFVAFSVTGSTGYEQIDADQLEILQEASGDVQPTPPPVEATPDESAAIGIIGGADGPTAIFVAGPGDVDILSLLPAYLLLNIPTGIYIVIYALTRRNLHRRKTIDKTTIQDL